MKYSLLLRVAMLGSVLLASVFSCTERPADGVQPRGAGSAALYLSATAAEQWYRAQANAPCRAEGGPHHDQPAAPRLGRGH